MSNSIKYNDQKQIATDMIRRFDRMTDQDRERMGANLGIDASDFQTRIVLSTGNEKRARNPVEEFARQVPLVELAPDRWVIARNIVGAEPITKQRTDQVRENGGQLNHDFKSAVETIAGTVWSTATVDEVMARKAAALRPGGMR
ncbi:MAG: hypothetical protein K0U74_13965 [Alphaproteobacteria bacterium]|nr:hypothetical protein [Alphaproteobacteria bacterium]